MAHSAIKQFLAAVDADDVALGDQMLTERGAGPAELNQVSCDGKPVLACARSEQMASMLLDRGADVALVSRWWAPGIGVNPEVDPAVGRFLVQRGAELSVHAAAALGLVDELREIIHKNPQSVAERGGDGCTPLHFARNVETAALLIGSGANIDARDEDHDSTPAQWLIRSTPDVSAYLIERGATPDIFLASALGDLGLVQRLITADPACVSFRISKSPFHPIGYQGRGGTILQWTLGFNRFAHQVALQKQHDDIYEYLLSASDVPTRFLVSCVTADRSTAEVILAANPGIVATLADADLELLARYCWETNADIDAVRLMLDVGFPVDFPETSHGYSPLHNAAWGGYGDLVDLLLERGHPVDIRDPNYNSTPLGFALHCCLQDGRHPEGEYGRVVAALIDSGSEWDRTIYPTGNTSIDEVLRARMA